MKVLIAIFVLLAAAVFVSGAAASEAVDLVVGAKPGHQARYVGSIPYEEYAWMEISVLEVEGTTVNVSLKYDLRSFFTLDPEFWPNHPRSFLMDVASGRNNLFMFFVPVNLKVGDAVPVPSGYPNLTVEGVDTFEYASQERQVVYASYVGMPWGQETDGTFYWDQETGLLVEIAAKVDQSYTPSLKLTETNIWSISLLDWLSIHSGLLSLIVTSVGLPICLFLVFSKKKSGGELNRVSHPLIGKIFMGTGLMLVVIGFINLSLFNQLISSLSLVFALVLFVSGFLTYNGSWARVSGNGFRIDFGVVLIAISVILLGVTAVCAMYREIAVMVPYFSDVISGQVMVPRRHILTFDGVFFYPWSGLVSPLVSVALGLAMFGVFSKIRMR